MGEPRIKRELRRRSAIEPVTGYLKSSEYRSGCNYLKRKDHAIYAVLAAAGCNFAAARSLTLLL